ncbi:MAG: EscU/YscU/HrcU family type III secretion system export apparatus switch protein [Deltaproteobacteria bacterium]|nr:EscU/YscU/HrcU family type III secretion system export apparatus switch protein [Deltaproteobacteria bacterium]
MSEQDKAQQTEEATPRKKEKMRDEGQIAKSQDVGSAAVIMAVSVTVALSGHAVMQGVFAFATRTLTFQDRQGPALALRAFLPPLLTSLAPVLIVASVAGAIAGVAQTGGLFKLSLLAIKPDRFNPIPQLKKIIPGKESGLELLKQVMKMGAIAAVIYNVVDDSFPVFVGLASSSPIAGAGAVAGVMVHVATYGVICFASIAAFDYWLARRKFLEDAKMSKQDVKDEHKQEEGDPRLKAQRRRKARELAMARSVGDISQATVLIANPTHISIALRYEPGEDAAPMMIAKAVDGAAMEMRKKARKHGVPIVENRPLARALYRDGKLGAPIPLELYAAAAQVIAHVLGLRRRLLGVAGDAR